jgi:phage shock protein A
MKRILIVLVLVAGHSALAQEQQPTSNEAKALGSMVVEAAQREAQLRAQVFALQDEIARLKTQNKVVENKNGQ